ncbi:hypothetical protein FEM48_Zijuj10G0017800 [Ziziphus jujuba var. spinosa]|uniref:DC1 domain-containing protein n=1 Tax=Ziziphus jujuba var. spinosa TaxID=714518 RepID=A0A978UKK4_ZIZJJ|nr:hypothetical protein FEM48_Zijuj10G0017800 [Ziziphus jujuba var. spinosa]
MNQKMKILHPDHKHFLLLFKTTSRTPRYGCNSMTRLQKILIDIGLRQMHRTRMYRGKKYDIQYFHHDQEGHFLSPYMLPKYVAKSYEERGPRPTLLSEPCNGCGLETIGTPIYKCNQCKFFLHVTCSKLPKLIQHHFHPQHLLTLLEKPPFESEQLCCSACLKRIEENVFVLNCNECVPPFNLDLECVFLKPTVKHEFHEHLLAHFDKTYLDDTQCAAGNTLGNTNLFRYFTCNFNIHSECFSLPTVITYEDHVHPFTLASSLKKMVLVNTTTVIFVKKEEIQIMVFIYVKNVRSLLILNALFPWYAYSTLSI